MNPRPLSPGVSLAVWIARSLAWAMDMQPDGDVAHRLTLGGEVKLIFFVICVFGHVMPLQYATYTCGGVGMAVTKERQPSPVIA